MYEKSSIETLIKNIPLILIGLFLFIIGAAGGWPALNFQISELGWRIALAAIGVVVLGIGVLFLWREKSLETEIPRSEKYGIKIVDPENGSVVAGDNLKVKGVFKNKPPDRTMWLFMSVGERYWPQQELQFDIKTNTWYAFANIGSSGILKVMVMGKAGQALCKYCFKVGHETKQWPSIDALTPDIVECDRVSVVLK